MLKTIETRIVSPKDLERQLDIAYFEHSGALFRYCYFKIGDPDLTKDLLQEAFAKTWNYLTRGQAIENTRAFLYKVLNNLIIDEYRKKKNSSLDTLMENGFDRAAEVSSTTEDKIDGAMAIETLKKLREPYRSVLHMRYVEGLSIHEIATIMGQSRNTIAVKIHRGIAKAKRLFQHEL